MTTDDEAIEHMESALREARAEAAGYRAHNEALQLQVAELNGELAAAETQIVALRAMVDEGIDAVRQLKAVLASHAELVAALEMMDGERLHDRTDGEVAATKALASARKVAAP
jgi:predicted  nucleic acid-binding Zn-ribbon protein